MLIESLILTGIASALLYFAYYVIAIKPVDKEMKEEKEKRLQAEQDDYKNLYNEQH